MRPGATGLCRIGCAVVVLAAILAGEPVSAQRRRDDPAPTIRALMLAIYSNDVDAYNRVTLPHPLRSRLTSGGRVNESRLQQLKDDPEGLQINEARPLLFQGQSATLGANGQYPVGTTGLFVAAHYGNPMLVGLVRRPEGWRVDLRWWAAMTELAAGRESDRRGPEAAIRRLLGTMLALDRGAASRLITDPRGVELLFAGAPSQREPSGVLEATIGEMPLVEIGPGEFYQTASRRVVDGVKAADHKVLVGWDGPVEMVFVVRRAGNDWRVEPEPCTSRSSTDNSPSSSRTIAVHRATHEERCGPIRGRGCGERRVENARPAIELVLIASMGCTEHPAQTFDDGDASQAFLRRSPSTRRERLPRVLLRS